jgi:hypothetical protein
MYTRFTSFFEQELLNRVRNNPLQTPSTDLGNDTVQPADLLLSHTQAHFPAYEPTPEDEHILSQLADNQSNDPIHVLARKIDSFDKYYTYSDTASTLADGDRLSKELTEGIAAVEDARVRGILGRSMWADVRSELLVEFPWLETRFRSTAYTRLIAEGVPPENAKVWVGTINGLRDLMARVYIAANATGQLLVWANDYERARYYDRFRKNDLFCGVALPPALYVEVDALADMIDSRGFRQALALGKSEYSVVRQVLENGDWMYTVHRFDNPMLSFFFAAKPA